MIAIKTFCLFSLTQNTRFTSSAIFEVIEFLAILTIVGAAGAEFVLLGASIGSQLKTSCKRATKRKRAGQKQQKSKTRLKKVEDREVLDGSQQVLRQQSSLFKHQAERRRIDFENRAVDRRAKKLEKSDKNEREKNLNRKESQTGQ